MEEGGGFPWVWAMVSLVSPELPVACPRTKGVPKCELINLFGWFDAGSSKWLKLVPFASPISELQHAPLPLLVLRVGSVPSSPHNFVVLKTKAHLGSNLGLGSASTTINLETLLHIGDVGLKVTNTYTTWRVPKLLVNLEDEVKVENNGKVRSSGHAPWLSTF